MKILQVLPYFHPAWIFGGPVRVLYDISGELVKRGHDVTIYTSDVRNEYSRVKNEFAVVNGVEVHYFRNVSIFLARRKIFITPSMVHAIKSNIKLFDIVHIHGYLSLQNPILHYFLMKQGVPYVLQAHGALSVIGIARCPTMVYDRLAGHRLLKDASKLIALSQMEARQYRDFGVPKEKICIIPNGINLSKFAYIPPKGSFRRKFSISEDQRIVLYLGRIHKSKRLDLLVEAFSIVKEDFNNAKLVVIGPDDGYASAFSKLASSLGIGDKVILTGFVEEGDKLAALVDSSVFVTPCFNGFPIAFLEACFVGCPIITTSNELEWIHGNVGYVVDSSPIALARAISNILRDDSTLEGFQKNCKQTIKKFDVSIVTAQLENVYTSLVNGDSLLARTS